MDLKINSGQEKGKQKQTKGEKANEERKERESVKQRQRK